MNCKRDASHGPMARHRGGSLRCNACRRARAAWRQDHPGAPKRHRRGPASGLKWGPGALRAPLPEDGLGVAVLEAIRSGGSVDAVSEAYGGCSTPMARYLIKRMAKRGAAMAVRTAGLMALEADPPRALRALTVPQLDAARLVLAGATEVEAGRQLGITQAAVSSRVRLAAGRLRGLGGAWARAAAEGLADVERHRNLTSFQGGHGGAG